MTGGGAGGAGGLGAGFGVGLGWAWVSSSPSEWRWSWSPRVGVVRGTAETVTGRATARHRQAFRGRRAGRRGGRGLVVAVVAEEAVVGRGVVGGRSASSGGFTGGVASSRPHPAARPDDGEHRHATPTANAPARRRNHERARNTATSERRRWRTAGRRAPAKCPVRECGPLCPTRIRRAAAPRADRPPCAAVSRRRRRLDDAMTSEPSTLFDDLDLPRPVPGGDVDERGIPLWAIAERRRGHGRRTGSPDGLRRTAARPGGAAQGPEPAAAPGGRPRRPAAAHRRRCRVRQDPGPHPPDRLPAGRPARPARPGPRHHLHQQGGRRDEGAGRRPHRPARQGHVGDDVPLGVRADPAPRGDPARPQVDLLDLRRRRQPAPHDPGPARPRPRPEALPAASVLARGEQPQERPRRRGDVCVAGRRRGQRRSSAPRAEGERRPTRCTSVGFARPTPWTSTTSSCRPSICSRRSPTRPSTTGAGSGTSSSTSTRTPTSRSTSWSRSWWARPSRTTRRRTRCRRASCASSATPTSRSTRSAARRSATSSSSSRTTPTRGPSCWSRTTAPRRPSCAPPTR